MEVGERDRWPDWEIWLLKKKKKKTGVKTRRQHIWSEFQLWDFTSAGRGRRGRRRAAVGPSRGDGGLLQGCLVVLVQPGAVLEEKQRSLCQFYFPQ